MADYEPKINVKVSLFGFIDMLRFKNMANVRRRKIDELEAKELPKTFETNEKATFMHPEKQTVIVEDKIQNGPDAVTVVLKSADGKPLAPFRAGQYISVSVKSDNTKTTRSYSLCSSPDEAWRGIYNITVKRVEDDGFVSKFIQDDWKVGQTVSISAPQGSLYYEPLRDEKNVIALAGGSGITPFVGMAKAIRDGYEDFNLTILYGSNAEDEIIYKDELKKLNIPGKVRVVHVLAKEQKEGFEKGFLTAELIRKYAEGKPVTVFMCGPQAMYNFLDGEIAKTDLDRKHVRRELFGMIKDPWNQPGYDASVKGKTFRAKVRQFDREYEVEVRADEPLLTAFDRAGISAPSRCRSGECGWCRSRLISGEVFVPEKTDGRREADKEFGYIHPCSTFAKSDLEVELPGQYQTE